ncbi:PAS domain S-box protein [Virgibacillus sp. MSP4-1]|uniref:PAS domain S-box protein n=1 Tax=Virgibacillus sp. MSP4-1 TaxID=2700081 RepID=UPI0003A51F38|nr:PAS domain S-box protein [Virgibacillus sp. MSP4-1]QHS23748.1 PAS domain S-box protein [Virgibacillus sp. MSP4-1]
MPNRKRITQKREDELLDEYIQSRLDSSFTIISEDQDPFLIMNTSHDIVYGSPWCEELTGYSTDELEVMNLYDLIPNQSVPIHHFFKDSVQTVQTDLIRRDFTDSLEIKMVSIPIFSGDLLIGRYIILKRERDDPGKKETDREAYYHRFVEQSPFGILVIDHERIKHVNLVALRTIGALSKEAVAGINVFTMIPTADIEHMKSKMEEARNGLVTRPFQQQFVKQNGETVNTEIQVLPTIYNNKRMTHLIIRGVYDNIHTFDLSVLIAMGLAKEIKEPVVRIKGFMDLIRNGNVKEEYFKVVDQDLNYIKKTLEDVLILENDGQKSYGKHELIEQIINLMDG